MATLYEIRNDLLCVLDGGLVVDEETGEILFDSEDLDALQAAYEDKLEACGLYIKNLESDAAAIRAEEKALAERRKTLENKAKRLREYVLFNLEEGKKIETPRIRIGTRMSEAVEIREGAQFADEYCRIKRDPDKTAIKAALKDGAVIEGAELVKHRSLQIK